MADKNEEPKDNKVFDVAEPGETKLNIGSKPMVIGHQGAADTSVSKTEDSQANVASEADEPAPSSKRIRIEPLKEQQEEKPAKAEATEEVEPKSETAEEPKDAEGIEGQPKEETVSTKPETPKVEPKDESRDFAAEAENEDKTAQDIEEAREAKIDELRKSKKYFVHIKEKNDMAFGKVIALLFAIFISVAGVYALADAGIIPGGELLPARFIGSETENDVKLEEVNPSNGVETDTVEEPDEELVDESTSPVFEFENEAVDEDTFRFTLDDPYMTFDYPSSLGEVVLGDVSTPGRYIFEFEEGGGYVLVLNSSDRVGPSGHDSPTLNLQSFSINNEDEAEALYLEPETTELEVSENANELLRGDNYVIFETQGITNVFFGIATFPPIVQEYDSIVFDYLQGTDERRYEADDEPVLGLKSILDTLDFVNE